MSIFDDLGDPLGPPAADPLTSVLERVRRRRVVRRGAAASVVVAAVVAFAISANAFTRRPAEVHVGGGGTTVTVPTTATSASKTTTTTGNATTTTSGTRPTAGNASWSDRRLTITAHSLGRVEVGMTLAEAQAAAGVRFGGAADGAFYPTTLPAGYPHLFVDLGPNGTVTCIGAQIGDAPTILQNITTSAGVRLGDTASRLLAIYGTVARHLDAPPSGIAPRAGYVVTQPQGNLAFSVRPTGDRITGIYAGDHNLTPSTCNG